MASNYSPQVGDFDGDGVVDVLTGSNCCAYDWCHWYRINDDGKFSRRFDIRVSVDAAKYDINAKHESRPRMLDWDRDGVDDLVVVLHDNETVMDEDRNPAEVRTAWRIFVSADSDSLPKKTEAGIAAKSELPRNYIAEGLTTGAPAKGADVNVELRAVVDPELEKMAAAQLANQNGDITFQQHFEIADFNNDGNFDLLFSDVKFASNQIVSSLYWMENLTDEGEPKFAAPIKIFELPPKWKATSIAVVDLDDDDQLDVVASVYRSTPEDKIDSQLWILKSNSE